MRPENPTSMTSTTSTGLYGSGGSATGSMGYAEFSAHFHDFHGMFVEVASQVVENKGLPDFHDFHPLQGQAAPWKSAVMPPRADQKSKGGDHAITH